MAVVRAGDERFGGCGVVAASGADVPVADVAVVAGGGQVVLLVRVEVEAPKNSRVKYVFMNSFGSE